MDGEKFDDLLKRLCTTRLTRLSALRGLAVGAAAALTGATLASDETVAKNKKKKGGGKKSRGKQRGRGAVRQQSVDTCLECKEPTKVETTDGNDPNCGFRFNVPEDSVYPIEGTYDHSDGDCKCTIAWKISADGKELSFGPAADKPPCIVTSVVVKGGDAYNTYTFQGGTLCASGLKSPEKNGNIPEISHFGFCTSAVSCCPVLTCEKVGCTDGPICDGCGGRINCPCVKTCPDGTDDGPNNKCDTSQGICVCTKNTCKDVSVECGKNFDDRCCGKFDCNCPTNCPDGTDDGPNNKCTDEGKCVCRADTCASKGLACTSTPQNDGCCGEFSCPCPTDCSVDKLGPKTTCTDAGCVCEANTCASLGVTCGIHDDGCCGTVDCGPCPEGCTPGYWKNHSEHWEGYDPGALVSSVFNLAGQCGTQGGATLLEALSFQGGNSFCGGVEILLRAAVAALLNAAADLNYPFSEATIIADVNAAIATGLRKNAITLAKTLDDANNAGCPCNNQGCPD